MFSCLAIEDQMIVGKLTDCMYMASDVFQVLAGYLKFMTDLGFLLHGVKNRTVVESLMQKVLSFEQQLADVRSFF